jgi:hypothetical protein
MPVCIECAADKPSGDYYAHPQMAAGHLGVCKECHKRRMKVRARTNPAVQEYDRRRAKTPERRQRAAAYEVKWREKNPLAYKAHYQLTNAVRDGRIKKLPCEFCGEARTHGHHRDYAKPLDVVWLCAKCHHRLHAAFPELEGKSKA